MQPTLPNNEQESHLSCLLIPVQGRRLVLPNVTVAEVAPYQPPQLRDGCANWMLGSIEWRGTMIPVISYELFTGENMGAYSQDVRIVVVNAPSADASELKFFGLIAQGIPSQVKLEEASIKENLNVELVPGQAMAVTVETGHGIIPDLDALEVALHKQPWQ